MRQPTQLSPHHPQAAIPHGIAFAIGTAVFEDCCRHRKRLGDNSSPTSNKFAPKILVVDDDALMRWSVAETLGDHGFRVIEASDGASAVRALRDATDPADAVLLDLHLPDSDDLRVLTTLLAMAPATPVIMMTAHGSPELHEEARALGAFAVVEKPFEMGAIAPLVEGALSVP